MLRDMFRARVVLRATAGLRSLSVYPRSIIRTDDSPLIPTNNAVVSSLGLTLLLVRGGVGKIGEFDSQYQMNTKPLMIKQKRRRHRGAYYGTP
jgi:hypothetical protein